MFSRGPKSAIFRVFSDFFGIFYTLVELVVTFFTFMRILLKMVENPYHDHKLGGGGDFWGVRRGGSKNCHF